ncbi:MAG: hypothetical protein GY814_11485 [Gammaproteobacteria bacterium]|nr:hypothetical protein [Gammaproteobacteria bacterium]
MIKLKFTLLFSLLAILCLPFVSHAETDPLSAAINKAGKQRMLSQRIAKSYFFLGDNVRPDKAREQLKASLAMFEQHHNELKSEVENKEIHELFAFIDIALAEYTELVSKPYDKNNGNKVLDLSETLLEVCQSVVAKLEQASKLKKAKLVNIAGRQRMLSQRIAKYYIAYQAGFHDQNSVEQLQKAVTEFESALKVLVDSNQNTAKIASSLGKVESLWKVVRKFFLDQKKGGLPVTVFATTDSIMNEMNRITNMYEQVVPETASQ